MAVTVLHELTHAAVAYALGVRSTLHNYWVNLDLTPEQAATNLPALIGVAGPTLCLVFGVAAWVASRRARGSAVELPMLFFAVFGIGTFFGNLTSTAFIGDFSAAAIALQLPMPARYAASVLGLCLTAAVHFHAGRELARWIPSSLFKVASRVGGIVVMAIAGTVIVILANLPSANAVVRAAEASFWIFAAVGALATSAAKARSDLSGTTRLRWFDAAPLIVTILIVRLLVRGIPFVP
jgi:hypothetical protein